MRAHRQRRTRPFPAGSRWRSRARLAAREPGRESRRDAAAARPPPPSHQRPLPGPLRWRCGPHRCGARRGGSRCAPAGPRAGRDAGARPAPRVASARSNSPRLSSACARSTKASPCSFAPGAMASATSRARAGLPSNSDTRAMATARSARSGWRRTASSSSQPASGALPAWTRSCASSSWLSAVSSAALRSASTASSAAPRRRRARLPPRRPLAPAGRLARAAYRPRMQERSRGPEESVGGSSPWVETVHARPAVAEAHGNSRG